MGYSKVDSASTRAGPAVVAPPRPPPHPRLPSPFHGLPSPVSLLAGGRPAAGHRRAGRRAARGPDAPDAARRHRLGQDLHHRQRDRAVGAADAGHLAQQDAGGAAVRRVQAVLPRQRRRLLHQLLRLLPARGLRPVDQHLHREGRAASTTTSTGCGCRPRRMLLERDDVVIVASVSCIYGIGSPEDWKRHAHRHARRRHAAAARAARPAGRHPVPAQRHRLVARPVPRARRRGRGPARRTRTSTSASSSRTTTCRGSPRSTR